MKKLILAATVVLMGTGFTQIASAHGQNRSSVSLQLNFPHASIGLHNGHVRAGVHNHYRHGRGSISIGTTFGHHSHANRVHRHNPHCGHQGYHHEQQQHGYNNYYNQGHHHNQHHGSNRPQRPHHQGHNHDQSHHQHRSKQASKDPFLKSGKTHDAQHEFCEQKARNKASCLARIHGSH